jgi:hypothetical protein
MRNRSAGVLRLGFTLAILASIGFGANEALGARSAAADPCAPYSCPPLNNQSCWDCCVIGQGFNHGECTPGGGCFCSW